MNQENLINDVASLVDIIKSGEYDKLLSLAFKLYGDGTAAVKECIKKEEINLEGINSLWEYDKITPDMSNLEKKYLINKIKNDLQTYQKLFNADAKLTKPLCESGCRTMYTGYQLSMCNSICVRYPEN